jgi:hypothetical protein
MFSKVSDFIEGNLKYYKQHLMPSPKYLLEQYHYRLSLCNTTCIPFDECEYCGCPPMKKAWVSSSCNKGEKFPDLMNAEDWKNYKQQHNIDIEQILTQHEANQK